MINRILGVYFSSENFTAEYDQIISDAMEEASQKHSKALKELYNMKVNNSSDSAVLQKQLFIVDATITEACNSVADALYKKGFTDAIAITGFSGLNIEEIESIVKDEIEKSWNETCEITRLHNMT